MSKLKQGMNAPDFSILVGEDKKLSLSELSGKYVVLYFYPKDNTPGCTIEARGFNALLSEFVNAGAEIIGVSRDDLKSHDNFKNLFGLNFYLGSDEECRICNDYGVWVEKSMFGKKYMGIDRVTFLIDKKGKIAHIWTKVKVNDHAQEVLNKIRELD
jgi:thioredoxin-dependent peroxiredoxin